MARAGGVFPFAAVVAALAVLTAALTSCTGSTSPVSAPTAVDRTAAPALPATATATASTGPAPTAAPTALPTTAPTALPTTAPTAAPSTVGSPPTVTPIRTPPRPRTGPVFPQPPVQPGELVRAYAGTESSGLPVDAVTVHGDAVGGRDYVLSAGCAAAGTGVRLAFVFSVVARGEPTPPAQEQVDVPCDGRLHDAGVHAYVSGVVEVRVAPSPGTSPDYVGLVRPRRAGDDRTPAPGASSQSGSTLFVPAAGPGEIARVTPDTGPVSFTAIRGEAVRVAAACVAGRPGAVARWHIDAEATAAPLTDGSGKADGSGVADGSAPGGSVPGGDGSDGTIASAVLACDGRPHVSTHTLVTTGEVSLTLDRDGAGDPGLFSVTVTPDVVAAVDPSATARPGALLAPTPAATPTAEAPGSRPTPVG